jgi:hypothetical protein
LQSRPVVFPIIAALLIATLYLHTQAYAIILHPTGEPPAGWTDKPANAVVGRWSSNASFVVIAPKWIITTRHQNTNPATVDINGVTYNCIYNPLWIGGLAGTTGNADIRLIRLKNLDGSDPALTNYAEPYLLTTEQNDPIVIGGYGKYRGDPNFSGGILDGYKWTGTSNDMLRWGQNIVINHTTVTLSKSPYYSSFALVANFDENGTTYEAAPAEWDSGGGWFIKTQLGSVWKLAALNAYVERDGVTVFNDYFWGIRISSYYTWINGIINSPADYPVGDLNGDHFVDELDLAILAEQWLRTDCLISPPYCRGADFQANGKVNFVDFALFAQNWLLP